MYSQSKSRNYRIQNTLYKIHYKIHYTKYIDNQNSWYVSLMSYIIINSIFFVRIENRKCELNKKLDSGNTLKQKSDKSGKNHKAMA